MEVRGHCIPVTMGSGSETGDSYSGAGCLVMTLGQINDGHTDHASLQPAELINNTHYQIIQQLL